MGNRINNSLRVESWGKLLAGILFLLVGIIVLFIMGYFLVRDGSLWFLGRRVEAEVVDQWLEETSEEGASDKTFRYYVGYQFKTNDGEVLAGFSTVGPTEWTALPKGSRVPVLYFPLYPQHNRIDDTRFIPVFACLYVPFMVLSWVGIIGGWYLIRNSFTRPSKRLFKGLLEQDAS